MSAFQPKPSPATGVVTSTTSLPRPLLPATPQSNTPGVIQVCLANKNIFIDYWQSNLPTTWSVRLSAGLSVCYNSLNGGKLHFHTPIEMYSTNCKIVIIIRKLLGQPAAPRPLLPPPPPPVALVSPTPWSESSRWARIPLPYR